MNKLAKRLREAYSHAADVAWQAVADEVVAGACKESEEKVCRDVPDTHLNVERLRKARYPNYEEVQAEVNRFKYLDPWDVAAENLALRQAVREKVNPEYVDAPHEEIRGSFVDRHFVASVVGKSVAVAVAHHRMLEKGETIKVGDEMNRKGQWVPVATAAHGAGLYETNVGKFRRPVAQEYRMLKKGDVLQEGDESYEGEPVDPEYFGDMIMLAGCFRRPVTLDKDAAFRDMTAIPEGLFTDPHGVFVECPKEDEPWMPKPPQNLREDIQRAINCRSAENGSDTPDWILAEYLIGCLENFDKGVKARESWYGNSATPVTDGEIPVSVENEPDLGEWLGPVAVSTLESHACGVPDGLPPLPPVPEGYSRWVYRGMGWYSGREAVYGCTKVENPDWGEREKTWGSLKESIGVEDFHYIEAVK